MKILIVGGGIGGLALGAFLKDSLIEYDIVEKCPDWNHQGYLVAVWDNGRDILRKLGLDEAFDGLGSRVKYYSIRDGTGTVLRTRYFSKLHSHYGGGATVIERKELHALLLDKNAAGKVRMGVSVQKIQQDEMGVTVTFSNGETKLYDLIVGADGAHSFVRASAFGKEGETYTNWRVWYGWVDRKFGYPSAILEYVEHSAMIFSFSGKNKTLVNFFAPADHTVWDSAEGRIERVKELFKEVPAIVPDALAGLRDEDLMPTDLLDVDLPSWVRGRAVLLGDAAHSFGPITGMGCSMAMEDGYVLAANLMNVSAKNPLPKALEKYQKKQRRRVALVKSMTRTNRLGLLTSSRLWRKSVNLVLPWIPQFFLEQRIERLLQEEI